MHERDGRWTGIVEGEWVAEAQSFDAAVRPVLARLLAPPKELLTVLTGADPPPIDALVAEVAAAHPDLEIEVHEGGQAGYAVFLGAE